MVEENLLNQLNPAQQKVVTTTEGPVLVLAGAGSGKTRSIIYRAAYLISKKRVNPWNILAVTFTNKAARELKERLYSYFGISSYSLWFGTFHSICTRILRQEVEFLPVTSNFSIYDSDDQKALLKKIYKKLNIDSKYFPLNKIKSIISNQKNSLILPKDFFNFNEENAYTKTAYKIYEEYQKQLVANNSMDFDDLLLYTALLLHDNEAIRRKYEKIFRYVMIDEYQDTNYAQFKIVNLIAGNHQNLCVVGDDDQAIYTWRGADIKNILEFEKDYKNVTIIKLEQNYRSPAVILNLANSLISNNLERHQKELWTKRKSDEMPMRFKLLNGEEEAKFVAEKVTELKLKGSSFEDCVILYRTNAQSRVFEKAFNLSKIPYQIIGGINFYQRKEIKDILAYLKYLVNPADLGSFNRIINFPTRGIGKVTIERIISNALNNNEDVWTSLKHKKNPYLSAGAQKKVNLFTNLIKELREESQVNPISEVISTLLKKTQMLELLSRSDDPQDVSRVENIKEFLSAAEEFSEMYEKDFEKKPLLTEYLQNITLQTDLDTVNEERDTVKLMTMHNAKGLEFKHVFVVGLEEELLPHIRSMADERSIEEERRLLYVAITRAKETVMLTYAESRRVFGSIRYFLPSRFLHELDENFIKYGNSNFYDRFQPKKDPKIPKIDIIRESQKHYRIGQEVLHPKFGVGKILNVNGKDEKAKLTISFSNGELKKIIGTFIELI
ncbi:MAG: UvrD-helicase domain-containing protein [Candidatus Cloacimonetes bacterium]|nr:UvrD-helicase domain-containing protein [Candidatus Cloacimonadota bacterium]